MEKKDIARVLDFQKEVLGVLKKKEIFVPDTKEELYQAIETSCLFGYFVKDELVAYRSVLRKEKQESYWSRYINDDQIKGEQVLSLESTLIRKAYRGNALQRSSLELMRNIFLPKGIRYFTCTISPENQPSFINMLNEHLSIIGLDILYSDRQFPIRNVLRYVLFGSVDKKNKGIEHIVWIAREDIQEQKKYLEKKYIGIQYNRDKDLVGYIPYDKDEI